MKGVLTMSVFEHFRMLQNAGGGSQGALSSATGLQQSPGRVGMGKAPEKSWPLYIWSTNKIA